MWNSRLDEAQAGIKIAKRNINILRYADDTTLMEEGEEELKSLLMKVKGESEKADLKLNFQKTKIMASSSITSWQIEGETMETVTDYFLGCQDHCRWWLQPWNWKTLAPWKKSYDKPRQHVKMQKCHFASKSPHSQNYGFSSSHDMHVRVGPKRRLSAEEFVILNCGVGKSLESLVLQGEQPVNPKENQSWIFTGRTDAEAEAPILWPPDTKSWLIRKDPDSGKDWMQEKEATEDMALPIQWTWVWASSRRWWRTGKPGVLQSMGSQRVGHNWVTEQQ